LNELQAFRKTAHCQEPVTTGLKSNPPRKKDRKTIKGVKAHHQKRKTSCTAQASDADDEVSLEGPPKPKILSPMQVLTDFSVENPVAVAPGICNYVSSSYSSDDPYDDPTAVVAPLPPPVAPSYEMLVRASLSSSVLSPEASAPVEPKVPSYERIDYAVPSNQNVALSDFPGVDFLTPTNGQISSFCSEESTPPCPPTSKGTAPMPQAHRMGPKEASGDDTQGIDRVFSPMKTFNKVVHASKKKGQQVLDKMSKISSDSYGVETWGVDAEQRSMSLEGENKRLLKENEDLRTANERLLQEKEELLKRLMNLEQDNSDADPDLDVACGDASDRDEAGDRSSLVEDSLLEHMAVIRGYRLGSPSNEEKRRPQSSQLSRSILQNYQAKFQHGL
jgi:hypothetical protein